MENIKKWHTLDHLPQKYEEVLCVRRSEKGYTPSITIGYWDDEEWYQATYADEPIPIGEVLLWQPLPEVPEITQ